MMNGYQLVLTVCVLTSAGQICQKLAADRWRLLPVGARIGPALRWLFLGCALLGLGMFAWLAALRLLPLSAAYPMLSLNFVLVALASRLIFKEKSSPRHWAGVLAVSFGVILMGLGA